MYIQYINHRCIVSFYKYCYIKDIICLIILSSISTPDSSSTFVNSILVLAFLLTIQTLTKYKKYVQEFILYIFNQQNNPHTSQLAFLSHPFPKNDSPPSMEKEKYTHQRKLKSIFL